MEKPKSKTGSVITVMGRQGSGKTPTVKELMLKAKMKNNIVYDPRKEYDGNEFTIFNSVQRFRDFILDVKDSFIVVEEATGFISSFKDLEFTDFLISVQHNRNIIVLLFHSILDAPPYILRLSRHLILLQTNDDPQKVKSSRSFLFPYIGKARPMHPVFIDMYKT